MKNNWLLTLLIAVVVGVAAFYGGMQYSAGKIGSAGNSGQGLFGRRGMFRRNGQNFQSTRGSVVSIDNNSMTVKLSDGSTRIVVLPASVIYINSAKASRSDVKVGDMVAVFGTNNSDGSVTAQDVQLNPLTRSQMTGGNSGTQPSPTGY